jgi:DNA polymerase
VGKTAGNNLLQKNGSLGALRGKLNDFHGLPVVVTYHPAALLRNPQWKRPTWEDVQLLRAKFDELVEL